MASAPSWAMPTPWPKPRPSTTTTGTWTAARAGTGGSTARASPAAATRSEGRRTAPSLFPPVRRLSQVSSEPLSPAVGWGVLHLFCRLTPATDAQAVLSAVKAATDAGDHQVL